MTGNGKKDPRVLMWRYLLGMMGGLGPLFLRKFSRIYWKRGKLRILMLISMRSLFSGSVKSIGFIGRDLQLTTFLSLRKRRFWHSMDSIRLLSYTRMANLF